MTKGTVQVFELPVHCDNASFMLAGKRIETESLSVSNS
jgi:hypothetical protein